MTKLEPLLADLHDRLQGVWIEQLPFAEFVRRYDRPGMLIYCDPPYYGCEDDYGTELFSREDFAELAALAAAARGKVIISINDRPEVREIFAGLERLPIETTYTLNSKGPQRVGELVIANFAMDEGALRAAA